MYCKTCGGTNLWFLRKKESDRKSGWKTYRTCRECYNELQRKKKKASGINSSEKTRLSKRRYREANRGRVNELNRESKLRARIKRKERENVERVSGLFHDPSE